MNKNDLNQVSDDIELEKPVPMPDVPMAKNTKSNPNAKSTKDVQPNK
jgi:hypothetical protein